MITRKNLLLNIESIFNSSNDKLIQMIQKCWVEKHHYYINLHKIIFETTTLEMAYYEVLKQKKLIFFKNNWDQKYEKMTDKYLKKISKMLYFSKYKISSTRKLLINTNAKFEKYSVNFMTFWDTVVVLAIYIGREWIAF